VRNNRGEVSGKGEVRGKYDLNEKTVGSKREAMETKRNLEPF